MGDKVLDNPPDVAVFDGAILIYGTDGIGLCFTPEPAEASAILLMQAANAAREGGHGVIRLEDARTCRVRSLF